MQMVHLPSMPVLSQAAYRESALSLASYSHGHTHSHFHIRFLFIHAHMRTPTCALAGPHTPQNTDEQSQEHYRWIKQAYPFPTSVFIGQSGVGKSSLLNCVMPSLGIKTRNVWRRSGQGKHTTSNTLLHYLEDRTDDVRVEADVDHDRTASDDSDGGAEVGGEDLEGMEEHDEGKGRVGESEEKGKVARENEEGEGEYDICDDVNNDDHDDSDDSGDEEREEEVEEVKEEEEDDDEDEEDWYYEEEQPVLFEYQDLGSTKADIIDSPGFQVCACVC